MKDARENLQKPKFRYPNHGPFVALGPNLKVVASGMSEEEAKLKAHAAGCPAPIIAHNGYL